MVTVDYQLNSIVEVEVEVEVEVAFPTDGSRPI
jgi:hypothetical protein